MKKPSPADFLMNSLNKDSKGDGDKPSLPMTPVGATLKNMTANRDAIVLELKEKITELEKQGEKQQVHIAELEAGIASIQSAGDLRFIDPKRCRPMKYNGRLELSYNDDRFASLEQSMKELGQIQPAVVRPISEPEFDFEIAAGHRRWKVCERNDRQLLADVKQISQREALKIMETENKEHQDKAPYEYALSWRLMLDDGIFASQSELAEELGRDRSLITKYMSLLDMPNIVYQLMTDVRDLKLKNGSQLASYFKKNPFALEEVEKLVEQGVKIHPDAIMSRLGSGKSLVTSRILANGKQKVASIIETNGRASSIQLLGLTTEQEAKLIELLESFVEPVQQTH